MRGLMVVAGGWWLAAAHGGVVLAARQSTVLSNHWELDLALWLEIRTAAPRATSLLLSDTEVTRILWG